MFGSLFLKECKQIRKSTVYYIFLACLIFFMTTQLGRTSIITRPVDGAQDYGEKITKDPERIMSQTLEEFARQIYDGKFTTYPFGFYKAMHPSEEESRKLLDIFEDCIGQTFEEFNEARVVAYKKGVDCPTLPRTDLTYDEFKEKMVEVSKIIGKGSSFEQAEYESRATEPMTYEDAMKEYDEICNIDGVTDAFMRIFCDYSAIILSLLPVFLGVTRCVRDRRAKATLVVYSKSISSTKIILSRYLSNIVMIFVPVLLLGIIMHSPYIFQANSLGVTPHYLSCIIFPVIWLIPEITIVLALSFLLTEIVNGIFTIVVQVVWAFISLFSASTIVGGFGMNLIPRWNSFGDTKLFLEQKTSLYENRLIYFVASIVVLIITILLYDWKRKGGKSGHGKEQETN